MTKLKLNPEKESQYLLTKIVNVTATIRALAINIYIFIPVSIPNYLATSLVINVKLPV